MAQTKNLVVTSLQTNGDKVFVRIGDSSPSSTSTNSSAIQFLQDSEKTFATSDTQSAFRIRHDSQDSQLVFQVSNRDGDTYSALTINDLGGININSVLTFEDSQFIQLKAEDITAKHIIMNNTTQITGMYGILFNYVPAGTSVNQKNYLAGIIYNHIGTPISETLVLLEQEPPIIVCQSDNYSNIVNAHYQIQSIIYNYFELTDVVEWGLSSALIKKIPLTISKSADASGSFNVYSDNLYVTNEISASQFIGDGSQLTGISVGGWKTVKKIDSIMLGNAEYVIYTTSIDQIIDNYNYLTVFLNDTLLTQSSSINPNWDYKSNGTDSTSIIFNYNIPVIPGSDFYLTYQYSGGK